MLKRSHRWLLQLGIVVVLLTLTGVLINNLAVNLIRTGLGLSLSGSAAQPVLHWPNTLCPIDPRTPTHGLCWWVG